MPRRKYGHMVGTCQPVPVEKCNLCCIGYPKLPSFKDTQIYVTSKLGSLPCPLHDSEKNLIIRCVLKRKDKSNQGIRKGRRE